MGVIRGIGSGVLLAASLALLLAGSSMGSAGRELSFARSTDPKLDSQLEVLEGHVTTNEALHLTMTATKLGASGDLTMLARSHLAGATLRAPATEVRATVPRGGTYGLSVVLKRASLRKGATYVIHLAGVDAQGKTTSLAIRFRG